MKESDKREKPGPGREKQEPKPRVPKEKLSAEDAKKELMIRKAKILLVTAREWFGLGKRK